MISGGRISRNVGQPDVVWSCTLSFCHPVPVCGFGGGYFCGSNRIRVAMAGMGVRLLEPSLPHVCSGKGSKPAGRKARCDAS